MIAYAVGEGFHGQDLTEHALVVCDVVSMF
jgi:hypothetical protein